MPENTILIVDDNTMNVKVLGNLLKSNSYNVEFALNGKSALNWITKNDFDLILLDIMMPEMDGYEVANALKKIPGKKDIPIIFLTAKNDEESILKGFSSGGVDFLTKPFIQSELLARVSTHIALKNAREVIKQKNRLITESLDYARLIQNALLPGELFKSVFPESFIIYHPKDIVSGDFYWIKEVDNKIVFVIADCTGHGIPGAFMSILGISLLNEIVPGNNLLAANKILDVLRSKIKLLLAQNENERNEGIDMSLCIFNKEPRQLEFSGAQSTLYRFSNNHYYEYKGDKQPVGTHLKEGNFTNYIIDIKNNDRIYLASDGIKDQFGGERGKKLGSAKFKEFLINIQEKTMIEQGVEIEKFIKNWKGNFEQVDDIVFVGLQF